MAASFHRTTMLCSDFYLKDLLGVSQDNDENILITCKGVVKQYNVVTRKQVRSWVTKSWHPFTSAAVRDPATNSIVAAISNTSLSLWTEQDDDVEKVKRYNFESGIERVLVVGGSSYVVFRSGAVEELQSALATRRDTKPGCLADHTIARVFTLEHSRTAILLANTKDNTPWLFSLDLDVVGQTPAGHQLTHGSHTLTGACVLSSLLVTLWSNGELYTFNLDVDEVATLPGRRHGAEHTVVAARNTHMLALSPNHLAIVGMDKADEGGVMVLREISFGISICSRKLKMYHDPPLAWLTNEGVVVAEGGSLALVPYTLQDMNAATMLGVQIANEAEYVPEACGNWQCTTDTEVPREASETMYSHTSAELSRLVMNLNKPGLSESISISYLVKSLVEQQKLRLLYETVDVFREIPEASLVTILNYYLSLDPKEFEGLCSDPPLNLQAFTVPGPDQEEVKCPWGLGKCHFINGVLRQEFTEPQLVPHLYTLSFDHAVTLIQYLHFLITTGQAVVEGGAEERLPSLAGVARWLSLLLDTKYHQLVMTSQVHIHRLILSCYTQINNMRGFLEGLLDTDPLVRRVVEGRALAPSNTASFVYSLERLKVA